LEVGRHSRRELEPIALGGLTPQCRLAAEAGVATAARRAWPGPGSRGAWPASSQIPFSKPVSPFPDAVAMSRNDRNDAHALAPTWPCGAALSLVPAAALLQEADQPKPKRRRRRPRKHPLIQGKVVKRRTRTGCLTCRRRKKKCDEARPTCKLANKTSGLITSF